MRFMCVGKFNFNCVYYSTLLLLHTTVLAKSIYMFACIFLSYMHCAGAGSAGLGVCSQIVDGLMMEGLSREEALQKFVVFSEKGVLGEHYCDTLLPCLLVY